jgi:predicted nucleic acid-binding protein
MSGFLLDTNVISEFNRTLQPDRRVRTWLEGADNRTLHVSVLTLAEIRFDVELLTPGKKRLDLERWLNTDLNDWFAGRILPVSRSVADLWGSVRATAQLRGRRISIVDGLIAATALHYDLTVVSRNVSDFEIPGLTVMNPWSTEAL